MATAAQLLQGAGGGIQGSAPTNISAPSSSGISLQNSPNTIQVTAPTSNQYNGASLIPPTGGNSVLGASTVKTPAQIAQDAQNAKIAAYLQSGQDSQLQSGLQEGSSAGSNYQGQAGQLYSTVAQGENTINEARKNIGINQINSIKDLMSTIRNGLAGTGVQLGNTNALDSSAAGAAARAYANYGNVETNKINNSAETGNADQDTQQQNLDIVKTTGLTGLKAFRDNAVSTITTDAQRGLDSLASTIAMLGGDASKIDVAGIRQQILDNAQAKLAQVDQYIQGNINPTAGMAKEDVAKNAYAGANAGVIPSGPGLGFQLADPNAAPTQTLGGADTSLIPLALKPRDTTA